jgi:hypothetical protein
MTRKNQFIIFFLILFYGISMEGFTQKIPPQKVPGNIKSALQAQFPEAQNVKWQQDLAGNYEAEFKVGKNENSVTFNADGQWLGNEIEMEWIEIPTAVRQTVLINFKGYKIKESERVNSSDNPEVNFYAIELQKKKDKMEVLLSEDGKIVKKSKD